MCIRDSQKHTTRMPIKSRLFRRKSASRESMELISVSLRSSGQHLMSKATDAIRVRETKAMNIGPIGLFAKACTEESTPERVRKVPNTTRA